MRRRVAATRSPSEGMAREPVQVGRPGSWTIEDLANRLGTSYLLRYSEDNGRGGPIPRSTRHTAFYHHHTSTPEGLDVVICLQPTEQPSFNQCLDLLTDELGMAARNRTALCVDPLLIHSWIFSIYSPGWSAFSRVLGDQCSNEVYQA